MRRLSLTAALAGAFALITLLTFYFVGSYLYHNLYAQLLEGDTREIVLKAQHLRSLVAAEDSVDGLRAHLDRIEGQVAGNDAFLVQVRSGDDRVLMDFNPSGLQAPAEPALPDGTAPQDSDVRQWRSAAGGQIRGIAVRARLLDGEAVTIVVARSLEDVLDLLRRYRNTIARAVALGALLAMALSYALVRRALHPLRRIIDQASRITMEALGVRLDEARTSPELRELAVSLNGMLTRLEHGFQLLSQYTENLAHDLRTPVTNLRGQTEVMLARVRSAEDYQALLASNLEEYERLSRMIENILFLARAGNAQIALRRTELNLGEQLRQVVEYFGDLAEENGAALRLQASGTIRADAVLFRRAVGNLLSNALRYTPKGGVIELTAQHTSAGTMICVSNSGPGIAAEHLDKIFQRFYRIDQARTNSADSTGLGLAIVRSIMELHQGKASAESANGITRFKLFFPDVAASAAAGRP